MKIQRTYGGLGTSKGFEIREHAPLIRVLDVCCGPGNFSNYLSLIYPTIVVRGVDSNPVFVKAAQKRFEMKKWQFTQTDAIKMNLEKTFDLILASSAYHHISDKSKLEFLCNLKRHLAPEGAIVVCENFLPEYSDEESRQKAIEEYYGALLEYFVAGNGTPDAIAAIKEVQQLEQAGIEEHKVSYKHFEEHICEAGLRITTTIPVWQPKADYSAGSHVIVLHKA